MKKILATVFRLIICGIETLGLCIFVPVSGNGAIDLVTAFQTSDCLGNLVVQINANPSNILYGQSSVVRWSVDVPSECGFTSTQLNGQPVAPFGSQTVTPTQSTTYRVTVLLNIRGISTEKAESTRVTVNDSETYFWCPYFLPAESSDRWQANPPIGTKDNEPRVPGLDETLNVPAAPLLLGSGLILDYNDTNPNDLSPVFVSGTPILSTCAFIPVQPGPDLKPLIPEQINPAADSSAT